jgi:hypothetical protein
MIALWLARGAVVALLAYPAAAQVIGQETAIMGGEAGFLRPSGPPIPAVVIDAMPYTRTVTCSDYTLTGSAPGAGAVSWSASPSGDSGVCTGTTSWTCVVNVDPDASGEGVETITVAQSGAASDTETIGFYVDGEHSCFLSQSINGTYNSGIADLDAVATWENLGSSALDVTQGTAGAQPTFRTGIVNGSPVVRCDGGDLVVAATAADWTFLHDGTGMTASAVMSVTSTAIIQAYAGTSNSAVIGMGLRVDASGAHRLYVHNGASLIINAASSTGVILSGAFYGMVTTYDELDTPDQTQYVNGTSVSSTNQTGAPSGSNPANPLTICQRGGGGQPVTGDVFRVLIYESALDATQRGINQAVDEWALGGTLPVTP